MRQQNESLFREMFYIALPITLQSLFQSSLSIIDQIMVGQLGSISVAGIGLGSKYYSFFNVTVTSIATAAGIMIAQYYGKRDQKGIGKSFQMNSYFAMIITAFFMFVSLLWPQKIMGLYTKEILIMKVAVEYVRICAVGFLPLIVVLMLSALLRSTGYAKYPMYASIISVLCNTTMNYIFIFGKLGLPKMGVNGAALATTVSCYIEMFFLLYFYIKSRSHENIHILSHMKDRKEWFNKVIVILSPLFITEFMWSLGENVYAMIYGHMGTNACAAMTLTNPVQGLLIGLFSGVSAAAGVIIGKRLGSNQPEKAYHDSVQFIKIGMIGSVIIGAILMLTTSLYVRIFSVDAEVKQLTQYILIVFGAVMIAKVTNMILGGGILRSGGKTKYTMFLDLLGTWGVGIPLGLLSAYVFHLPVHFVYLILSMEEFVRLIIGACLFKSRKWMNQL